MGKDVIKQLRRQRSVSQRDLAAAAGLSFGALQRLESGATDPRWSTITATVAALGFSSAGAERLLARHWLAGPDSVAETSLRINLEGEETWTLWLFQFVDAYRRLRDPGLCALAPDPDCPRRVRALYASSVEFLLGESAPEWCRGIGRLEDPWFLSEAESLKASALVESPAIFRKRNLFVLGNFLERG